MTGRAMKIETATKPASKLRRRGDRGIILITTLLLMTLLAGFAIAAQKRAFSQAQVLEKVRDVEDERIALQSARALALPLVGEAILDRKTDAVVAMRFAEQLFEITLDPAQRREWYRMIVAR